MSPVSLPLSLKYRHMASVNHTPHSILLSVYLTYSHISCDQSHSFAQFLIERLSPVSCSLLLTFTMMSKFSEILYFNLLLSVSEAFIVLLCFHPHHVRWFICQQDCTVTPEWMS